MEEKVKEIIDLINSQADSGDLKQYDLEEIKNFCDEKQKESQSRYFQLIKSFSDNSIEVIQSESSSKATFSEIIPLTEATAYVKSFEHYLGKDKSITIPVYRRVADQLFSNGKNEIVLMLGEMNNKVIFLAEINGNIYRIDSVKNPTISEYKYVDNFDRGLGKLMDDHLFRFSPPKNNNTRKFRVTRDVYEELVKQNTEAILFNPGICTSGNLISDSLNGLSYSYQHRFTYIMSFGSINERVLKTGKLMFDKNNLCPPGNC